MTRKRPISVRKTCRELLQIPKEEILALVADKESYYSPYPKTKIKPDGTRKVRMIEPSYGYLKVVQKRINEYVLQPAVNELSHCIMGGRPGFSVIRNARYHLGSKAVLSYDVKDCFGSISEKDVCDIFRYRLNFCEEAANMLAYMTTYEVHVPQGVPTSTNLAILALEKTCGELRTLCDKQGMKFSVWVDDIVISGDKNLLKKNEYAISQILGRCKYSINPDKETGVVEKGSKTPRKITGIFIDANERISAGRRRIRTIRSRLRRTHKDSPSLKGKINFLEQVNPKVGRRYKQAYREKLKSR